MILVPENLSDMIDRYTRSSKIREYKVEYNHPLVISHRGYAKNQDFDRNTLPSFKYALELGVDALECDLRVTQDGKIVIHHDPFVRIGYKFKRISTNTYNDLLSFMVEPDNLPQIQDILGLDHHTFLFLQIKDPNTTSYILDYIRDQNYQRDLIFIMGYLSSVFLKTENSNFHFGKHYLLPTNHNLQWVCDKFKHQQNIGIISPNFRFLTNSHLDQIHKLNFMSIPFTVNDHRTIKKFLAKDVTGIYTDELETALDVIG